MIDDLQQLLRETHIDMATVGLKLCVSFVLGVMIGFERQMRRRDAGLRTFSLICTGSCGAMLLSIWIPQVYPDFLNGDPGRIAAQVLTGIGFLGAGAIVRGRGSVQGLTTAACIWQVAVIGMAVGAGLYGGAVLLTALTLFVLVTVENFERRIFIDGANRILVVRCSTASPDFERLSAIIAGARVVVNTSTYSIDYKRDESTITYKVTLSSKFVQKELCDALHGYEPVVYISMMA